MVGFRELGVLPVERGRLKRFSEKEWGRGRARLAVCEYNEEFM